MSRIYPHFFFFRSVKRIEQEVIFFWLRKNVKLLKKPQKIFIFLTLASHNYSPLYCFVPKSSMISSTNLMQV